MNFLIMFSVQRKLETNFLPDQAEKEILLRENFVKFFFMQAVGFMPKKMGAFCDAKNVSNSLKRFLFQLPFFSLSSLGFLSSSFPGANTLAYLATAAVTEKKL